MTVSCFLFLRTPNALHKIPALAIAKPSLLFLGRRLPHLACLLSSGRKRSDGARRFGQEDSHRRRRLLPAEKEWKKSPGRGRSFHQPPRTGFRRSGRGRRLVPQERGLGPARERDHVVLRLDGRSIRCLRQGPPRGWRPAQHAGDRAAIQHVRGHLHRMRRASERQLARGLQHRRQPSRGREGRRPPLPDRTPAEGVQPPFADRPREPGRFAREGSALPRRSRPRRCHRGCHGRLIRQPLRLRDRRSGDQLTGHAPPQQHGRGDGGRSGGRRRGCIQLGASDALRGGQQGGWIPSRRRQARRRHRRRYQGALWL